MSPATQTLINNILLAVLTGLFSICIFILKGMLDNIRELNQKMITIITQVAVHEVRIENLEGKKTDS